MFHEVRFLTYTVGGQRVLTSIKKKSQVPAVNNLLTYYDLLHTLRLHGLILHLKSAAYMLLT